MTDQEKLKAYEIEIYGEEGIAIGEFDVDTLIESHRRLRKINKDRHNQYLAEIHDARVIGMQQGYKAVTENEYVKVQEMKKMTVLQLASLLTEGNDV